MIRLIRTLLGSCPTCGAPYDDQEDHIDGHRYCAQCGAKLT